MRYKVGGRMVICGAGRGIGEDSQMVELGSKKEALESTIFLLS